jgi:hypothetical protein
MDERQMDEQREAPAREVPTSQVKVVPPIDMGDAPVFYANLIQVATSPHDFTLHFNWFASPLLREPLPPGEQIEITARPVASITIPVTIMNSFIRVLQDQFANYQALLRQTIPDEPIEEEGGERQ